MNYRMMIFLIGRIVAIEALFMIPGLGISLARGEAACAHAFLATIFLLLALGLLAVVLFRPDRKAFYAREGFVIVGLAWIAMSAFGALPFFISGAIPSFIDCIFETVSGFTTTGASILTDVEALPMGLLYWRSFTHWLGGMGVLVFLLAIVPMSRGSGYSLHLLRAESPGPQVGKLVPRMHQTAKILYGIYVAMTLVQIVLLLLGNIPLFDAVTISYGTAGTGGFAIKNSSLADYSPYIQTVVTIFMALFGINFNIYYLILIGAFVKVRTNEELRAYLGIMLGSIALITWNILPLNQGRFGQSLLHAAFQVSSVMTTTGFATADFNLWPEFSRFILVVLMILGASAGSTGGGIKTARLVLLLKSARASVNRMMHPRSVRVIHMDGQAIDDDTMRGINAFMVLYCVIIAASTLLVSIDNQSFETNITAVLACVNNIGPGLGLVGPTGNYAAFSWFSKLILTADMLIGRLEIFPILALFNPYVWRK